MLSQLFIPNLRSCINNPPTNENLKYNVENFKNHFCGNISGKLYFMQNFKQKMLSNIAISITLS